MNDDSKTAKGVCLGVRLSVYRKSEALATKGPRFGLLRAPAKHQCSPPGLFLRFLLLVVLRPVGWRSLWRCRKCNQVWWWVKPSNPDSDTYPALREWQPADVNKWIEAGGEP